MAKNKDEADAIASYLAATEKSPAMKKSTMGIVDYVIVYDEKSQSKKLDFSGLRRQFFARMDEEDLKYDEIEIMGLKFVRVHAPFYRLCMEAEAKHFEMPLKDFEAYGNESEGCLDAISKRADKYFKTDTEVDFISAPFDFEKIELYKDSDQPEKFFRPAVRSFLVHQILINIDIREEKIKLDENEITAKQGLPSLIHQGAFKDSFLLHEMSAKDPVAGKVKSWCEKLGKTPADYGQQFDDLEVDPRMELDKTWRRNLKYQPLWRIRNYFGEKIALYFAWSGELTSSLIFPTVTGIIIFFYGIIRSATSCQRGERCHPSFNQSNLSTATTNLTALQQLKDQLFNSLAIVKQACDNDATPFFAIIICLWGTVFLESWKRKRSTLTYEWDCESYAEVEPDRPQFVGTRKIPDPIIPREVTMIYPFGRRLLKYMVSATGLLIMVLMVFISVTGVIVYRVFFFVKYCDRIQLIECLMLTTVVSSILNAVSIMILGKFYDKVAYLLTRWENHRTQSEFDNALIVKLFAFQFANSYSSLFYIAFFRGMKHPFGILDLGPEYVDTCGSDGDCMSMLSVQVLAVMVIKPLPKFFKDVILAFVLRWWRRRTFCQRKSVGDSDMPSYLKHYELREYNKPKLGDFTLGEYTEKIIQYGYLMLFAASFPLAPLIAMLTNFFDLSTDANRLIWLYRRPVGYIASDIGMWYSILEFLNLVGVVSNSFLIFFTSHWSDRFDDVSSKLWGILIVEHTVLIIKFIMAYAIPDIPAYILLSMRRQKYQVDRLFKTSRNRPPRGSLAQIPSLGSGARPDSRNVPPPDDIFDNSHNIVDNNTVIPPGSDVRQNAKLNGDN